LLHAHEPQLDEVIYEASMDVKNFLSRPWAWRRSAWCCDAVWFVLWHETVSF